MRQTDMFRGKCLNFDASVGCQTILPALVHDRADASAEGTSAKGDMGDRDCMIEHALGKSLHCTRTGQERGKEVPLSFST